MADIQLPPEFDRRLTPARADIAASQLRGNVNAARFVDGTLHEIQSEIAPLMHAPDIESMRDTELLFGEPFTVYDMRDGWAWGQSGIDQYVGYLRCDDLALPCAPKTHRIANLRTHIFTKPDIKSRFARLVSMNAQLHVTRIQGRFAAVSLGDGSTGFVTATHICPLHPQGDDFVEQAMKFQGTPYLWGGRSSLGLDCSALVQLALARIGIDAPRDTDMQEKTLGHEIAKSIDCDLQRGDLVFWDGHVGIMSDGKNMIHANSSYMQVTLDRVQDFARTVESSAGPVTSVRRLG